MTPASPRRFRFGLRTLFVLVVIVAVPCAWVGYAINERKRRFEEFAQLHQIVANSYEDSWARDNSTFLIKEPPDVEAYEFHRKWCDYYQRAAERPWLPVEPEPNWPSPSTERELRHFKIVE